MVPWHWDDVHQKSFDTVKTMITNDIALAYLDCTKVFEVYTNASSIEVGTVITQSNMSLASFTRILSETQQNTVLPKLDYWPLWKY